MGRINKTFTIPVLIGLSFLLLYNLLPKIHIYLWLLFLFGYGFWVSIIIIFLVEINTRRKDLNNKISFCISGIVLYAFTLLYLSKSSEVLIDIRSRTFLPFNGIGYLLMIKYLMNLNVRYYDYLMLFIYAFVINYFFIDEYNMFSMLDLMLALWITSLLIHITIIAKRDLSQF